MPDNSLVTEAWLGNQKLLQEEVEVARSTDAATLASTDRAAHAFSAAAELARCTGKLQAQFGGPLIGSINS